MERSCDFSLQKLQFLKIADVYKLETAIFMYKHNTNSSKLPAGENNLFYETSGSQVHTKCSYTANPNYYFIPFCRANRQQNSIQ